MSLNKKSIVLKYVKYHPESFDPIKASSKSAGYDLKSIENSIVYSKNKKLINTGLKIELPEGCYGRIAPRSSLSFFKFIDVGAGVIDSDYRGEIKILLFNHSDIDFEIKKGDRIAQLICEKIYYPELKEVKELTNTLREEKGFGSSGIN